MPNPKLSQRSLSALVFALGASAATANAHANHDIQIQDLEISEESQVSEEDFRNLDRMAAVANRTNWGGSGSFIRSGNYSSFVRSGNYSSFIRSGNYASFIRSGNYANFIRAGNYGRVEPESIDGIPSPQMAALRAESSEQK